MTAQNFPFANSAARRDRGTGSLLHVKALGDYVTEPFRQFNIFSSLFCTTKIDGPPEKLGNFARVWTHSVQLCNEDSGCRVCSRIYHRLALSSWTAPVITKRSLHRSVRSP